MKQVAIAAIILGIMYAPMEDYAKMFIGVFMVIPLAFMD